MAFQDDEEEDQATAAPEAQDDAGAAAGKDAGDDDDSAKDSEGGADDDSGPSDDTDDLTQLAKADAPPSSQDKLQAIKDYLTKQYGKAADPTGVNDAVARGQRMDTIANFGHALETMARSRSQALGGPGADSAFYQGLKQQGAQGVQQAQASRQQQIQDFLAKNSLGRQAVNDQQTQGLRQTQLDAADPASRTSQVARAAFKANFPEIANAMGGDFETLSTKDLGAISQMTDTKAKIEASKEMAAAHRAQAGAMIGMRQDQKAKSDAFKDLQALGADLDNEKASSRSGIGQATAKVDAANRLMTFVEVTPEEVEAARKDPKARAALVAKMDQLTPQQRSEVVSGLMTQLTTGGGSLQQFHELKGETLDEKLANVKQWATGTPEPGNVGSLIVNNLLTLDNERATSQGVLDRHTSQMKAKHPQAFAHSDTQGAATNMLQTVGAPAGGRAPAAAPSSPPPAGAVAEPKPLPPPHGETVMQGKTLFKWNGFKYVAQPATAGAP